MEFMDVFERCAVEKVSTYEGGSDMKLRELHRGGLIFLIYFEYCWKERGGVCSMRRRYETWSRMSVGIPERRERVGGHVEGGRRILIWITKKWRRRMCTGIMWFGGRGGCC